MTKHGEAGRQETSVPKGQKNPRSRDWGGDYIREAGIDATCGDRPPVIPRRAASGSEEGRLRDARRVTVQIELPSRYAEGTRDEAFLAAHIRNLEIEGLDHQMIDKAIAERWDDPEFPDICASLRGAERTPPEGITPDPPEQRSDEPHRQDPSP